MTKFKRHGFTIGCLKKEQTSNCHVGNVYFPSAGNQEETAEILGGR